METNRVPYAVELYFDNEMESSLRRLWRDLADAGVDDTQQANGFRPHVSLGVSQGVDLVGMRQALRTFALETDPFPVSLSSLGLFPTSQSVVFLAPVPTRALLDAHERFHNICHVYTTQPKSYYLPERWVPHCTLAQDVAQPRSMRALGIAWEASLPLEGSFVEVGLSEFRPAVTRYVFTLGKGEERPVTVD